jgi:hypothetical protein
VEVEREKEREWRAEAQKDGRLRKAREEKLWAMVAGRFPERC